MEILIIAPNLLNVVLRNSSVIELLPPTNMVIPLRGDSGAGSGELGAGGVVFEEDETKLLYKFCEHKKPNVNFITYNCSACHKYSKFSGCSWLGSTVRNFSLDWRRRRKRLIAGESLRGRQHLPFHSAGPFERLLVRTIGHFLNRSNGTRFQQLFRYFPGVAGRFLGSFRIKHRRRFRFGSGRFLHLKRFFLPKTITMTGKRSYNWNEKQKNEIIFVSRSYLFPQLLILVLQHEFFFGEIRRKV